MSAEELKKAEKQVETTRGASMRGQPSFIPAVDIHENGNCITVIADMPGVNKDGVNIDIKDDQLKIHGKCSPEHNNETTLREEYETGDYFRQFSIASELIDLEKVTAKMRDGVLTLTLPKAAKATPRRIEVTAG